MYGRNNLSTYGLTCASDASGSISTSETAVIWPGVAGSSLKVNASPSSIIAGLCNDFIATETRSNGFYFHLFLFPVVKGEDGAPADDTLELRSLLWASSLDLGTIPHKGFCLITIIMNIHFRFFGGRRGGWHCSNNEN